MKDTMSNDTFVKELQKAENALWRYAIKLTGNREDAKELLRKTVVRAFCKKENFAEQSNFTAWLGTIMHNIFINACRRELQHTLIKCQLTEHVSDVLSADNGIYSAITIRETIGLLRHLPESLNRPLIMCIRGYNYKKIAERLNITPGIVRNRLHKERVILKRMLMEEYNVIISQPYFTNFAIYDKCLSGLMLLTH